MAIRINEFWDDLLRNQSISHGCYYLNQIDDIPDAPGIYGWFAHLDQYNRDDYFRLFHQKNVSVEIKGNLKEKYAGKVKRVSDEKDFENYNLDFLAGRLSSLIFCPPMYIGISINLKKRLKSHIRELTNIYHAPNSIQVQPNIVGITEFDTILESQNFAKRMGFTIKSLDSITLNNLVIKTIEMPVGYSWNNLQRIEKYLNRSYVPIFGRK